MAESRKSMTLLATEEFFQLPGNQLIELISSEELQVPSEDQVFKAVVEWVRFDYRLDNNYFHRFGVGVAVFYNLLYAVGGNDGLFLKSVLRFDPATEVWSSNIAPMSYGRYGHGVATLDGFIYAVGGQDYDPRVGKWEHIRPMTTCRGYLGSAAFDGHLYAAGGPWLSSAEKYDPRANRWTAVADMNEKRFARHSQVALAVVNGRLYAVGGDNGSTDLDTVEVFDPEANQWIIHSRMNKRLVALWWNLFVFLFGLQLF
ncbi:kelch repeat protein [Ostertagia ostertagi]